MRPVLVWLAVAAVAAPTVSRTPLHLWRTAGPDSIAEVRHRLANEALQRIAGREQEPAESVFRNIKVLTGIPAGRVIRMMDQGYGAALGVSCDFCHAVPRYGSEDSVQKQVARDMMQMVARINGDLLKQIPHLPGPNPIVNCTTCHRGQRKPALTLDTTRTG